MTFRRGAKSSATYLKVTAGLLVAIVASFSQHVRVVLTANFVRESHPLCAATRSNSSGLWNDRRPFLKLDKGAPREVENSGRCHYLPSIPHNRRIPFEMAENMMYHATQFFNGTNVHGETPQGQWLRDFSNDHRPLFNYNPSIVPLYQNGERRADGSAERDPDQLSSDDILALTGGNPAVQYVAVYRTSTQSSCFAGDSQYNELLAEGTKRHSRGDGHNVAYYSLLGIALLDSNLHVVKGSDVVVDLNYVPNPRGPSERYPLPRRMEDCRVFLVRRSLYLTCNDMLLWVALRSSKRITQQMSNDMSSNDGWKQKPSYVFPNVYGDGLQLALLKQMYIPGARGGKNFNIFRSPSYLSHNSNFQTGYLNSSSLDTAIQSNDHYIQLYPSGPHTFERMIFRDDERWPFSSQHGLSLQLEPSPSFETADLHNPITYQTDRDANADSEGPNQKTVPFFHFDQERGSACCISVALPSSNSAFLVGITHVKTTFREWWRKDVGKRYEDIGRGQYLNRLVAYNPHPPFDVVARSGYFCLGFGKKKESRGNVFVGLNEDHPLRLFGEEPHCPSIQFVSGISEHSSDSSLAIIGYGINDCYPRLIVVEKSELAKLLTGVIAKT